MTPKEITMGIGMKTRNDSSDKGTFNQEPKKRVIFKAVSKSVSKATADAEQT